MTKPCELSHSAIAQYAELVGNKYHVYDETGFADIDGLIEQLGGEVWVRDGAESMHVASRGSFEIFLAPFTSERRDRFTKAHELGHYFLHYRHARLEGAASFQRGGRSLAETQANVFAASLLMPESHFRRAYQEHDGTDWRVAIVFGVSPDAANVRASVLGLHT